MTVKAILIHNTVDLFADNLICGIKKIETRGVNIRKYLNTELELVTIKHKKRISLGKITFKDIKVYDNKKDWNDDNSKHLVPTSSAYNFNDKKRYGWIVGKIEKYPESVPFTGKFKMNGFL